jgi:hypothetical protein
MASTNAMPVAAQVMPSDEGARFEAIAGIARRWCKDELRKRANTQIGVSSATRCTLLLTFLFRVLRVMDMAWWQAWLPVDFHTWPFFGMDHMPALKMLSAWVVAHEHEPPLKPRTRAAMFLEQYDAIEHAWSDWRRREIGADWRSMSNGTTCRSLAELERRVLQQFPILQENREFWLVTPSAGVQVEAPVASSSNSNVAVPHVPASASRVDATLDAGAVSMTTAYDPFCLFDPQSITGGCVIEHSEKHSLSLRIPVPPSDGDVLLSLQAFLDKPQDRYHVCWPDKFSLRVVHVFEANRVGVDLQKFIPDGVTVGPTCLGHLPVASLHPSRRLDKPWRITLPRCDMARGGWLEFDVMLMQVGDGTDHATPFRITAGLYTPVSKDVVAKGIMGRPPHPDDPLSSIFSSTGDLTLDSMSISLLDPCSRSRIVDPARCDDCRHPQFFDLNVFLLMNTITKSIGARWTCPFPGCSANANNGRALVCSPVAARLLTQHPFDTKVTLCANGTTTSDGDDAREVVDVDADSGDVIVLE